MPELPEVENVARQLSALAGSKVERAGASGLTLRYALTCAQLKSLEGQSISIQGPARIGRYILLPLSAGGWLMAHLGMTGSLRLASEGPGRKHDHLWLHMLLADGSKQALIYNDPRRFGGMALLNDLSLDDARARLGLGVEPTSVIAPESLERLYATDRPIKPMLMDNALVTGVGNIYASEICHAARIAPERLGSSLAPADFEELSIAMSQIIAHAIERGGSTFRNYAHVDGGKGSAQQHHAVYGRDGQPCPRCGALVTAFKQAGRATFACPACQV